MADWFVFRPDGAHLGPWSSEHVASAIVRGEIPENTWLAPARTDNTPSRWLCALDVPVIVTLVRGTPIAPSKRESGMRAIAPPHAAEDEVTLPSARRADLERIDLARVDLDDLDDNSTEAMITRPVDVRGIWTDESLADTYPSARPPVTISEDQRVTTERPAHRAPSSQIPASDLYARLRRAAPASDRVPRDPVLDAVPDDDDDAPTRRAVLLTEPHEPTLVSRRKA